MHYPLATLHPLIQQHLHPRRLLKHARQCTPTQATWQAAFKHAACLRVAFMQQTVLAKDSAALTLLVQACTAGAVSLANRLHAYGAALRAAESRYEQIAHLQAQYAVLEKQLLCFVQYLRRYFPAHFNQEQPLPCSSTQKAQQRLAAHVATLQAALQTTGAADSFIAVVLAPFTPCIQAAPVQPLTYGRLLYLQRLAQELHDCIHHPATADTTIAVIVCLTQNNCNHPALVQYLVAQWQQHTAELPLPEAAAFWATRLREYTLMPHYGREGLYPALPPLRDSIVAAIRHEIQDAGAIASHTAAPPRQGAEPLVTTSLSVTQLAVLLRLLVHCGMIKCSNQSALFRQIAGAVRTEKAAKLSAESLRIKYHTPERTAISIVKDCLLQMVSALHKL
ncbi:hypothetical protein FC093_23225 [Ilyomonas limi]|uniref:Uncharacterized protein n=1 Tax=Ilyomonas limi TaxID=2575867 RepID=A0A4U3KPQ6_9BACT|nr:hypothetical protein [Ilyomonas limi]TKK64142.1 hypothetical protein FC093_23225 [Ilyomonas limi]